MNIYRGEYNFVILNTKQRDEHFIYSGQLDKSLYSFASSVTELLHELSQNGCKYTQEKPKNKGAPALFQA